MIHRTYTNDMTREEWLEERRHSLGGSDMGAILGLNAYVSPVSVWAEKTGKVPPAPDNEAMRQGRDLEDYVAQRFTEKSGKKVHRLNAILRNDDIPHVHANIDRDIVGENSGLECKTASAFSEKRYAGGDFPESYYAQCVSYLAVTQYKRWYLAALIMGRDFLIYQMTTVPNDTVPDWCESSVYVDEGEIDALCRCADDFWSDYVEKDVCPPMDGTDPTTDTLNDIYSDASTESVDLFGKDKLFERYYEAKAVVDAAKANLETVKQELMSLLGTASAGDCGKFHVTWKPQCRKTFDHKQFAKDHPDMYLSDYFKESTSRVMRFKKDKEDN